MYDVGLATGGAKFTLLTTMLTVAELERGGDPLSVAVTTKRILEAVELQRDELMVRVPRTGSIETTAHDDKVIEYEN